MMMGCPFFLPFIEVEQNVPPTIDFSSPGDGDTLVIQTEQYTAFVLVQDPDDTELTYSWSIEGFGDQPGAVPVQSEGLRGSQFTITRKTEYDGRELTVIVYDPAGESDMRSWPIQVLEASQ